ncbi:MAG: Gfo/Idh/MocA family protein [Acidimicrobiales bacterium]
MSATTGGGTPRPVRVGMIGCGDAARRVHLSALEDAGAEVIRFASKRMADAEAAVEAARHEAMATDDWRHVVSSVHIDAVDICTPSHLHAEMAMAAVEAGKHVLVESPMTVSLSDAEKLLKAAARKGVIVVPAHSVRFIPAYAALAHAAATGAIGQVTKAQIAFGHQGPDRINPEATWYLEKSRSGGGALIDLGVAMVDLLRVATGSEVTEVSATLVGERGDVEERAQARLTFASGAGGELVAAWNESLNVFRVEGTEGSLFLDATTPPRLERPDGSTERLRVAPGPTSIEAVFVDAVANDTSPVVNALDGRAAVAVITAAYESAATGAPAEVARPTW